MGLLKRGGARAGAGRPKMAESQRQFTKVARVPVNVDVEALVKLTEDIQALIDSTRVDLHPTSPRDERLREFLDELEGYLLAAKVTKA